jgi:hypothetical protein
MPELTNILHERETREPGWRDRKGKDQQMVNLGSDILSYLHRVLVKENRFKTRDGYGKDPRPFINTTISNWKRDGKRRRRNRDGTLREVPLDYEAALEIPDPTGALEDSVLENIAYEERKRELRDWGFYRNDDEFALLETVYMDDTPLTEVLESNGVSSGVALRKRLSRIRQQAVTERDELFTFMLTALHHFGISGKIPRFRQYPEQSEWWVNRAKASIQPGPWVDGKAADGKNAVAVRALTRGFRHAPDHIYLVALHKDCWQYTYEEAKRKRLTYEEAKRKLLVRRSFRRDSQRYRFLLALYDACYLNHSRLADAHKLIDPTRGLKPGHYGFSLLRAYPTELSTLNEAIAEIRDAYVPCLMSNAKRDKYYVNMDD